MDEVRSTTVKRPAFCTAPFANPPTRLRRSAMPQLPAFHNEPICAEPSCSQDDVLFSGSDDEYYDSPATRHQRLEEQARLFLEGRRPLLLSASLRGPFGRDSGWENPWRGKGNKGSRQSASQTKSRAPKGRQAPTRQASAISSTKPSSCAELGTTPSTTGADKDAALKKRTANNDWLHRRNLKRMRSSGEEPLTSSPSAFRTTRAVSVAKAVQPLASRTLKTSVPSRSFSAPVQELGACKGRHGDGQPLRNGIDNSNSPRQLIDLPSFQGAAKENDPECRKDGSFHFTRCAPEALARPAAVCPALCASPSSGEACSEGRTTSNTNDRPATRRGPALLLVEKAHGKQEGVEVQHIALQSSAARHGVVSGEHNPAGIHYLEGAGAAAAVAHPGQGMPQAAGSDVALGELQLPDKPTATQTTNTPATGCAMEASAGRRVSPDTMEQTGCTDELGMGDERLATQDQSPWARMPLDVPSEEARTASEAGFGAGNDGAEGHTSHGTAAAHASQSPWTKEATCQLPATTNPPQLAPLTKAEEEDQGPAISSLSYSKPTMALSQNPWAEATDAASSFASTSFANLPTSPSSPNREAAASSQYGDHRHEPFLPLLPPASLPSSGTAPSTPETKRSSLPTPDLTVSIKSFRRFRSPTPTPRPRRRCTKAGGLKSVLKPSRRRPAKEAGSVPGPDRRVRFALPGDAEALGSEGSPTANTPAEAAPTQRASSPPPQDKTLVERLPHEVDRFQCHFATVAGRQNPQHALPTVPTTHAPVGASQSVTTAAALTKTSATAAASFALYSSPPVGAKASRFLDVDAETTKLQQITSQQAPTTAQRPSSSSAGNKQLGAQEGDKENLCGPGKAGLENEGGDNDATLVVDDVQEVMDNLDDFLGLWNVDAELEQARTGML